VAAQEKGYLYWHFGQKADAQFYTKPKSHMSDPN
jgi:hypothetical protein